MRIVLFTGKGGVGKTSIAAATSVLAAKASTKTLVVSTDPAHSLADCFDQEVGSDPTLVMPGLWAQQVDAQERLEESWRDIREYAVELLRWTGMDSIEAEELALIPGLDELFALADIKQAADEGSYDLMVVDCAPTGETLRLLSLPDVLSWYIERIFPVQRKVVRTVRPVLGRVRGIPPVASEAVMDSVQRFYDRLSGVREVLLDPARTSIRLVVNPEKMVVAEAERTYTYLSLFGYRIDAVVVNRVLPDEVSDPYFASWKQVQAEHLERIESSFAPLPVLTARLFDEETVGERRLEALGEDVYGGSDPSAVLADEETMKVTETESGYRLEFRMPQASGGSVDLARRGDELFIKVGPAKRRVVLPLMLQRFEASSASLKDGWLKVRLTEGT